MAEEPDLALARDEHRTGAQAGTHLSWSATLDGSRHPHALVERDHGDDGVDHSVPVKPVTPLPDLSPPQNAMLPEPAGPQSTCCCHSVPGGTRQGPTHEVEGWNLRVSISPEDDGGAVTARFLPADETIVTRNLEGSITLRDGETLRPIGDLPAGASAAEVLSTSPYISADGEYLPTVREQQPLLIHIASKTEIGTFPNDPGIVNHGADVGPTLQLITGVDQHAVVWNLDVDSRPEVACRAAGRNLTREEWDQLGPANMAYQPTCPQWPSTG